MDSNKNNIKKDCLILSFPPILTEISEKDSVRLKALVHRFTREFEREYLKALRAVNR